MISGGISSIPLGWLGDKLGPSKIMTACAFVIGIGLVLSSQVSQLWHYYLTFGIIEGIGMGGTFSIATGLTSRWFVKRRGLAMGMVSAGIGLGTLIGPPATERLIATFGWSYAYVFIGIATWVIMIGSALLLRRDPQEIGLRPYGADLILPISGSNPKEMTKYTSPETSVTLRDAIHTGRLWMLMALFSVFIACVQLIMVHLVNYATDIGIDSFVAATVVSIIGVGSIAGRLVMGSISDKIGNINTIIISCTGLLASLVWLIFSDQLWMLYAFAVLFSFAYGGEVTLMPLLTSQFFGLQAVMALTGCLSTGARIGGALGSWVGGKIYDATNSYIIAFVITAILGLFVLMIAIMLKKVKRVHNISIRRISPSGSSKWHHY